MSEVRSIRFVDSKYNEKFRIPDGGYIKITMPGNIDVPFQCKYIDDYHTQIGSNVYHICEFAEKNERFKWNVEPIKLSNEPKKTKKIKEQER